ncbi:hypothetical protein AQUCO_00700546v1 [Aquilegia coerulea]|uniref:PHD-type zinc finger plants domain-containing protein n=1 Tax=Aquilegia coerulea TaxID=218851 RepID=A0A2G5EKI1_AQUCA|nr:hypothetical protein AQUCO_00700546v1 [Aquilegia coerulea]
MEVLESGQVECCMCGDYGLLNQLFQCKVCLSRSQHRYCSNLYPRNESFRVCNWCLKKEKENTEGTNTSTVSSSPSSSNYNNFIKEEAKDRKKAGLLKKKNCTTSEGNSHDEFLHINNTMKKSSRSAADKSLGRLQIHSHPEIGNNKEIKKQMFKGKVRKYKLLEDVCR